MKKPWNLETLFLWKLYCELSDESFCLIDAIELNVPEANFHISLNQLKTLTVNYYTPTLDLKG